MEWLKDIGIIGFLFFFIKGMLWIVFTLLIYFGLVDKEKIYTIKKKLMFWKKK